MSERTLTQDLLTLAQLILCPVFMAAAGALRICFDGFTLMGASHLLLTAMDGDCHCSADIHRTRISYTHPSQRR
ncbi:hypothetical protein FB45DRAFT_956565 [Roridomyces roridus]|uniref:Uncharacterized protein n=1 Tax=Roridomyces roridus TaxID=1738132 RepID=A0AAD7AZ47_9AGAR|nr:hypothetical protein FB45DRAFT_956565 [Roridomyces roridus]